MEKRKRMTLAEIDRVPDFGVVRSDSDVDREILFKQANTLRSDMRSIIGVLKAENAELKAHNEALANNCMRMGSDIHALEAENAELREAAESYRALNVCYRVGTKPSENLFALLKKADAILAKHGGHR